MTYPASADELAGVGPREGDHALGMALQYRDSAARGIEDADIGVKTASDEIALNR